MSEVIVITSGKGGVGKTTTSANVGTGLAILGKRVVLIDTDIGLRNLDVVMGLENRIVYNLVDVVEGNCRMKQALIRDKRYPNLYLLPSAQTRDKTSVTPEQMVKLVDDLRSDFDYILLDCPAGIEQGFRNAIAGADRALVVTTPEVADTKQPAFGFSAAIVPRRGRQFAHAPSGCLAVRFRKRGGPRSDFLRLLYHGRGGRFCRLLCCPSSGVKKRCAQIFQTCPITSSTGVPVYMALVDSWMR